jgi:chromosome segregation ATPase
MITENNIENSLQAEIEALRNKFPNTQELYSEVCILLFFRHGITPTANKLYQLVRKGSMSAPVEALGKFWADLREKSRVRIENPDLPEELKIAAGDVVGTLWAKAQSLAQETLTVLRAEAHATVQDAETRLREADKLREIARQELQIATITIEETKLRARELEQALAGEAATRLALEAQLASAQQGAVEQQKAMEGARRDFSSELEKLRDALKVTEGRYQAAESRAMLEIDRERTIAAKLQKELELVRASTLEERDRHRVEIRTLHDEIGNQMQRHGYLEGELRAVGASKELLTAELSQERESVRDLSTRLTTTIRDAEVWQLKAADAQKELESLRVAKQRRPRKDLDK